MHEKKYYIAYHVFENFNNFMRTHTIMLKRSHWWSYLSILWSRYTGKAACMTVYDIIMHVHYCTKVFLAFSPMQEITGLFPAYCSTQIILKISWFCVHWWIDWRCCFIFDPCIYIHVCMQAHNSPFCFISACMCLYWKKKYNSRRWSIILLLTLYSACVYAWWHTNFTISFLLLFFRLILKSSLSVRTRRMLGSVEQRISWLKFNCLVANLKTLADPWSQLLCFQRALEIERYSPSPSELRWCVMG